MNKSILFQTLNRLFKIKQSEKELLEQAEYIRKHVETFKWRFFIQQGMLDLKDAELLRRVKQLYEDMILDFDFQNKLEQHCESCKKALEDIKSYLDTKPEKIVELQLKLNNGKIHVSLFEAKYLQVSFEKAMGNKIYNISKVTSKGLHF